MKVCTHVFGRSILIAVLAPLLCSVASAQEKPVTKQISGGIVNGKATSLPVPKYPDDARAAKIGGKVSVQVLIDETGKVISANAISGLENVTLRQSAEAAALMAIFSPTRLSGQPVKVSGVIVYNFVAEKSNEERLQFFSIAAFLTVARAFVSEVDRFKEIFGEGEMFQGDLNEFPSFKAELEGLKGFETMTPTARREALDKAVSSIRSRSTQSEKWQVDVGQNLGEVMGSLTLFAASVKDPADLKDSDFEKLDESAIKISLSKIKDLSLSAPSDFPKDVLKKLDKLAAAGTENSIRTKEDFSGFCEKITIFIETVSPGSTK